MRFADTSFRVALVRRRERHHDAAVALQRTAGAPIVTSNLVLGEPWTFLNRRDSHALASDGDFSAAGFVELRP